MIRTVLAVAVFAFGVSAVVAQSDPIAARKALMKTNGDQNRVGTEMIDGKRPFDLDAAKKVLTTFSESGETAKALFPEQLEDRRRHRLSAGDLGEQGGLRSQAREVFQRGEGGSRRCHHLDTFKAQIAEVRKYCGGCHTPYRKKASSASLRGLPPRAWHDHWAVTERRPPSILALPLPWPARAP